MASKRLEEVIEKFAEHERYCLGSDILYREDVVKLLARQHAGFVRMVKNAKKTGKHPVSKVYETNEWVEGYFQACKDLLAALAAHRKGRTK